MIINKAKINLLLDKWLSLFPPKNERNSGIDITDVDVINDHKEHAAEEEWNACLAEFPLRSLAELIALYNFGNDDSSNLEHLREWIHNAFSESFDSVVGITLSSTQFDERVRN